MIIVKLMGGLGNQLFQYAFGRHLAIMNNVELRMDVSGLQTSDNRFTSRNLDLSNFNIQASIATENDLKSYAKSKLGKVIDLLMLQLPFKKSNLYIREPGFRFFKSALTAPNNSYLDGYWQSEEYFKDIRSQLLNELTLNSAASAKTIETSSRIKATNAVSIHVRRGDYISIAQNQSVYETCNETYYLNAMRRITLTVKDPVFYVFSDEPDWFRQNVKTQYAVEYITHNLGADSYQDLYLMSICQHNIIANSSFSWWGAWLNASPGKIVIAPRKWFKGTGKDTSDLIPKQWIQL
ncbi:MAG TPA: alpha-1,2-fucosyltransferase [Bacteroidia bacterium]|jgi:hypothetical protein